MTSITMLQIPSYGLSFSPSLPPFLLFLSIFLLSLSLPIFLSSSLPLSPSLSFFLRLSLSLAFAPFCSRFLRFHSSLLLFHSLSLSPFFLHSLSLSLFFFFISFILSHSFYNNLHHIPPLPISLPLSCLFIALFNLLCLRLSPSLATYSLFL